jgi:hypothetical protein
MSKRKSNNMHRRMHRVKGAILRQNHVALVHIDPDEQRLFCMRSLKQIQPTRVIIQAMADYPHQWTIFFAGICRYPDGRRYIKGEEIPLPCEYIIDNLYEGIAEKKAEILAGCNPNHAVGCGFIALPYSAELDEKLALELFERSGAWDRGEVAA